MKYTKNDQTFHRSIKTRQTTKIIRGNCRNSVIRLLTQILGNERIIQRVKAEVIIAFRGAAETITALTGDDWPSRGAETFPTHGPIKEFGNRIKNSRLRVTD